MSLLRFPSKKEIAKLARSKFVRGVGVCVRSHHFALCMMIHWDETLSSCFLMPLEMRLLIFFRRLE